MVVAVGKKNQLIFMGIVAKMFSSRMIILKITRQNTFVKRALLDENNDVITGKYAIESIGYFGDHLLWLGLSLNQFVQVFDFNTETGEFKELRQKRVKHQEKFPLKLIHLGEEFYYFGEYGKLMSLGLQLK